MRIKAQRAESLGEKIRGMMGEDMPYPLLLETRFGIHTFGLKFPIDVVVLDNQGKIVKLKESLYPNRVFFWNPKYDTLLELPKGVIKRKKLKVGSRIDPV